MKGGFELQFIMQSCNGVLKEKVGSVIGQGWWVMESGAPSGDLGREVALLPQRIVYLRLK